MALGDGVDDVGFAALLTNAVVFLRLIARRLLAELLELNPDLLFLVND